MQAVSHRLPTKAGRARYALRKQTIEPAFGIIKSVMCFRRLSRRGLKKATGEWTLVWLPWNLKRMAALPPPQGKKRGKPSARPEKHWPGNSLFRIVKFAGLAGARSDRRLALEAH